MDNPPTNDRNGAHLGEIAKSSFSGSGSDQTKSAIGPSCGISRNVAPGEYDKPSNNTEDRKEAPPPVANEEEGDEEYSN